MDYKYHQEETFCVPGELILQPVLFLLYFDFKPAIFKVSQQDFLLQRIPTTTSTVIHLNWMKPYSGTTVVRTLFFVSASSLVKITIWQLQRSFGLVPYCGTGYYILEKHMCADSTLELSKTRKYFDPKETEKGRRPRTEAQNNNNLYTGISSYHWFILSQELYKQGSISVFFWLSVFFSDKRLLFPFSCKNVNGEKCYIYCFFNLQLFIIIKAEIGNKPFWN